MVGDQGLGGEEGVGAGKADEEGPLQLLGHEVLWVFIPPSPGAPGT